MSRCSGRSGSTGQSGGFPLLLARQRVGYLSFFIGCLEHGFLRPAEVQNYTPESRVVSAGNHNQPSFVVVVKLVKRCVCLYFTIVSYASPGMVIGSSVVTRDINASKGLRTRGPVGFDVLPPVCRHMPCLHVLPPACRHMPGLPVSSEHVECTGMWRT